MFQRSASALLPTRSAPRMQVNDFNQGLGEVSIQDRIRGPVSCGDRQRPQSALDRFGPRNRLLDIPGPNAF
jgi:hypothetical protein